MIFPLSITGWWFGTWIFLTFHRLGIIIPTDELIFFRGVETTNQIMCEKVGPTVVKSCLPICFQKTARQPRCKSMLLLIDQVHLFNPWVCWHLPFEVTVAAEVSALPGVSAFAVPAVRGEENASVLIADSSHGLTPQLQKPWKMRGGMARGNQTLGIIWLDDPLEKAKLKVWQSVRVIFQDCWSYKGRTYCTFLQDSTQHLRWPKRAQIHFQSHSVCVKNGHLQQLWLRSPDHHQPRGWEWLGWNRALVDAKRWFT